MLFAAGLRFDCNIFIFLQLTRYNFFLPEGLQIYARSLRICHFRDEQFYGVSEVDSLILRRGATFWQDALEIAVRDIVSRIEAVVAPIR